MAVRPAHRDRPPLTTFRSVGPSWTVAIGGTLPRWFRASVWEGDVVDESFAHAVFGHEPSPGRCSVMSVSHS